MSRKVRGSRAGTGAVAAVAAARVLLGVLLVVAVACAPSRSGNGVRAGSFAPALEVDLPAMERTETGLYIQTLREGSGPVVRRGERVRVHYEGWLTDGTMFDSSRDRQEPLEIPIGMDRVIDGWDQGIVGMRVGEVRRLVVPPELAYGQKGAGGVIPPNATLVFEVELLGVR